MTTELTYYCSHVKHAFLWLTKWPFRAWHRLNLYWKIALWFWLAMCVMLILGAIIFTLTINPANFIAERTALFDNLEAYAVALDRVGMYKHTPSEALTMVTTSIPFSAKYSHLILLNTRNHQTFSVPAKAATSAVMKGVKALKKKSHPGVLLDNGFVLVGPVSVYLFPGEKYQLFLVKFHAEEVLDRLLIVTRNNPLYLLIAFFASLVLCFGLTHYLRQSLRRLQTTVHKIASGDLSARVGSAMYYQGDEIGRLNQAVDFMASQLETLIQQKQRLLRDVSHELRSPLTRLKISNALAYKKAGHIAQAEYERIELEISRLDSLIGQIIHWSKLSSGLYVNEPEKICLNTLVEKIVNDTDFEAVSMKKRVTMVAHDLVNVMGSMSGLTSAVENIIRNAIRFTPEDSTVEVEIMGASQAMITVRDYGPGVPDESLPMLFEPFYRVDETRGGDNSGSGLGMAISQAVIFNHKGAITACNVNPGLKIVITLPLS